MFGYEWANPAAPMLLSYDPSAEAGGATTQQQPHLIPGHQMLPLYDRSCLDLSGTLFPPPPSAVPLAAPSAGGEYPIHRYGTVSLPPAAATTTPPAAMHIGLNVGVRTYFSSSPDGELVRLGRNVYRRSAGHAAGIGLLGALVGGGGAGGMISSASRARCQAEGCAADLTRAKHYHRRHKVCEYHSKAAVVVAHGLTQRFCQQCSRFHVLSEFDQGKRSCRKRLAEHNRRRRKTLPLPALLPSMQSPTGVDATATPDTTRAPPPRPPPKLIAQEKDDSVEATLVGTCKEVLTAAPPGALGAPSSSKWMVALGSCLRPTEGVAGANSSSSTSSPSSCSSSSSSVLRHFAQLLPYDSRVSRTIWRAGTQNGHGHPSSN